MEKNIYELIKILQQIAEEEKKNANTFTSEKSEIVELLAIKEAVKTINGLTEGTLRKLIKQGKISHIRAGEGKRGKILIPKNALIRYFECANNNS